MQIQGFQDIINLHGYMVQTGCKDIALEDIVFTNIDFESQLEDKYVIRRIDINIIIFYDKYRKLTFAMKKVHPKCFGQSYYSICVMEGDCCDESRNKKVSN